MQTAFYECLNKEIFNKVYEPAEDSFLLIDAVEKDLNFIKKLRPKLCCEVGCGSGVVITTVAKALGNSVCYFATDVNPDAAIATSLVAKENGVIIEVVLSKFVNAFIPRVERSIDLLLFNPPYVVTPEEELYGDQLQVAVAGGVEGCQIIDAFLQIVPTLLTKSGILYLVCIKENNPDRLCQVLYHQGIFGEIVTSRRCGIETLFVLRFSYATSAITL